MNEKLPDQVKEFSVENCPNGNIAKVAKFHTNPYFFFGLSTQSIQTLYFG